MPKSDEPKGEAFMSRLHHLFFDLAFAYKPPEFYRGLLWAADKLMLMSPFLQLILAGTPWEPANNVLAYFSIFCYFKPSSSAFTIYGIVLLVLFHIFVALLVLQIISNKNGCPLLEWNVSLAFALVSSVGFTLISLLTFYLFAVLFGAEDFPRYKYIPRELVVPFSYTHIALLVAAGISFFECLILTAGYRLLCQERRLTIWCDCSWKYRLLEVATKIAILLPFVCDPQDGYAVYSGTLLLLMFSGRILLRFCEALTYDPTGEVADLFYDCCIWVLEVHAFCTKIIGFGNQGYYQYVLVAPIYAAGLCIVRIAMQQTFVEVEPRSEDSALSYLRSLLLLCHDKGDSGLVGLCGLLNAHQRSCCAPNECDCRTLLSSPRDLESVRGQPLKLNNRAYEYLRLVPPAILTSWKRRALRVLIGEVKSGFADKKPEKLQLALAEIEFYYFGNPYQALICIEAVCSAGHSVVSAQYAANLRSAIHLGIWNNKDESKVIISILTYQEKYTQFLQLIDESCECTVKFWSTLLEQSPEVKLLIRFGKELCEKRYHLLQIANDLVQISSNRTEFLVKYGLYMRLILHDKESASAIFKKLLWSAENSGNGRSQPLFRGDRTGTMLVVVSLEKANFFAVVESNNEVEYQLGYKRSELVSFSANKLMPAMVARQHRELVQRFFRTMEAATIDEERFIFVMHQDGYAVPCKATNKIVPTLAHGLQCMMLFYEDFSFSSYTSQKPDKTRYKIGAFMFNPRDEVLEVTKEALNLLKLGREGMEILKASARLSDMFPEIASHLLRPLLERPQGAVISYDPGRFDVEENKCEITAVDEEEKLKNLLWVRIVKERYGEEEVLLLIFSPIPERFAQVYLRTVQAITVRVAVPTYNNKIYRRVEIEETLMSKLARPRAVRLDLSTSHSPSRSAAEFSGSISTGESFSPQGASRRLLSASQLDLFAQELQVRVASNKTPALITRLTFVLLAFLCVVLSLITIESEQFASETANLKRRFSVIENYQIRYELVIYLAMCPMSYNFYLGGQVRSTFAKYCSRAVIRANRALDYNVLTRLSFSRFSLNYDYENVDIVDRGEVYMTSFYYAFIKYVNELLTFIQMNDFDEASSCVNNYNTSKCREHNNAIDYCTNNGFYSLRVQQYNAAKQIMSDFLSIANSGENSLYVIISVCMAAVVISSGLISVILIFVIKDKSTVMAIFAEIKQEEIRRLIKQAKSLHITSVRFQGRHVHNCAGNEEKYWRDVIREHKSALNRRRHSGSDSGGLAPVFHAGHRPVPHNRTQSHADVIAAARLCFQMVALRSMAKFAHVASVVENNFSTHKALVSEPKPKTDVHSQQTEEEKRAARVRRLSQIEYPSSTNRMGSAQLRNSSICRLMIVLMSFLIYGAASIYFNYYIHDFNKDTTSYFYDLTKRNANAVAMTAIMREAVRLKDKNPDGGGMFVQDYIDMLQDIENRVKEYNLRVNRWIFKSYSNLSDRLETTELCSIIDSYQVGQSGVCSANYAGSMQQGLSAGMGYYIAYHYSYSAKITAANFSNEDEVEAILHDPAFTLPGSSIISYLQAALELQVVTYRQDAVAFYEFVEMLLIVKALAFSLLFLGLYLCVLLKLRSILKDEILLTRGMLNMIPLFVIESNVQIQNKIWQRRYVS